MCQRVLLNEADHSVLVLCISSLTDACQLLSTQEELFARKVHSVTIMGGIELSDEALEPQPKTPRSRAPSGELDGKGNLAREASGGGSLGESSTGGANYYTNRVNRRSVLASGLGGTADTTQRLLKPDTAHNNTFDFTSAVSFYTRLQEKKIRLNVLTRFAAYGCAMPRKIYDVMNKTNSPIARRLFNVQQVSRIYGSVPMQKARRDWAYRIDAIRPGILRPFLKERVRSGQVRILSGTWCRRSTCTTSSH